MDSEITLTYTLTKDHLVGAWRQQFWTKALRSRPMVFSMALEDAGEKPRSATAAEDGIIIEFRLTEAEQVAVLRSKIVRKIASSKLALALYALFGLLVASAVFMMPTEGMRV